MRWRGPGDLAVIGTTGVCLLDFFCSSVRLCVLLSPCLCFVSFLCLDLYVFGDDALISWGSFMQAGHLCVLVYIWTKGEVGAVGPVWALKWGIFTDRSRTCFFCGSFVFLMSCVSHSFASVHCCLVVSCWERADLLALVGDVNCIFCFFLCGILGQVWYLIVSIPDLCTLTYFHYILKASRILFFFQVVTRTTQ